MAELGRLISFHCADWRNAPVGMNPNKKMETGHVLENCPNESVNESYIIIINFVIISCLVFAV